ncbi:MAG: hypothetical protein GY927_07720 [bacterium]|nr:hypothetical protein [bacterium]
MGKHCFCENRSTSGIAGFVKTGGTLFSVLLYRSFHADGRNGEGATQFGLGGATIDIQLTGDHTKRRQVILIMEKHRQCSVKIG